MFSVKMILGIIFSLSLSGLAFAEDSVTEISGGSNQSFAQSIVNNWRNNGKTSYKLWLTGPNTQALSGNKDGSGKNISMAHYFSLGYQLGSKWSVTGTQIMQQSVNDKVDAKSISFTDPYITFSNSKILNSDRYGSNLSGYARYYIPVSRATHDAVNSGANSEAGNGGIRVGLTPSKSFLDGALTFEVVNLFHYRLNKNNTATRMEKGGPAERKDYYFLVSPSVNYSLNPKFDLSLEYATGYLNHSTDGKLSKLNNADDGQWISTGFSYKPNQKLIINPYLSWGPVFRGLKNTDIGLILDYKLM